MTLKDVAEYSSLSQMSVRRAIQKGILKPFKDTGKKLFRKDDVDRWLNK
jgi:excisionase family DNA binding protein